MTDENDTRLPEGKTCAACVYFTICAGIFGCDAANQGCVWSPRRFVEDVKLIDHAEQVEAK